MATISELYRRRQGASLTTCKPAAPLCSTCGMLECTCRPRFFAGQVLNADDLNRLDAYIRAKHRLHNRQLHGWGVVNGLEVMCNPCGDGVAVGCGYALSPCGDDIVVCDAVTVAVCDLIARCRGAEAKQGPCPPFQPPGAAGCPAEEEWILAIRYAETPQRGVKPLYAPVEAECSCSCGGKAGCSCGSNGRGQGKKSGCACGAPTAASCTCNGAPAKPRGAPVQCEATVICEGYAFEVYRRPPWPPQQDDDRDLLNPDSPLLQRFRCCYDSLVTGAPPAPGAFSTAAVAANPGAWYLWAVRFQAHLQRHYQSAAGYHCALLAQLGALVITQPGGTAASVAGLLQAIQVLLLVALDGLFACLCSALLPPCPAPTAEARVPLAALHVAGNPCRVLRVCNWATERKFATTFPALQYWLSALPYGIALRQLLQTLCCFDVSGFFRAPDSTGVVGAAGVPRHAPAAGGASASATAGTAATGGTPFAGGSASAAPAPAPAPPGNAPVPAGGAVPPGSPSGTAPAADSAPAPQADFLHQHGTLRLNPTLAEPIRMEHATALLADVLVRREPLAPELLVDTLFAANAPGAKLPPASRANLPQFLLLNQLARPLADAALGAMGRVGIGALAGGADASGTNANDANDAAIAALRDEVARLRALAERREATPPAPDADAVASLREELAKLQAASERQAGEIEQLRGSAPAPRPKKGKR